jgi:hypothetical protein
METTPAPSQADADRLARLFADQPNESGIHVAPAFRMANRFDMPLGRGSEMTITSGGADRIDRDR